MYYELLFFCLLTSLVSIGFFIATHENSILHFLKRPVTSHLINLEDEKQKSLAQINKEEVDTEQFHDPDYWKEYFKERRRKTALRYDNEIFFYNTLYKPVFLCPRCMASFWSLLVWLPLTLKMYGGEIALLYVVPAIFISATINSILYNHTDL